MPETVGERLKRLRGKRSLGTVAVATGVSRGFLHQVESGKSGLGRENLKKFADFYKVSIDYILRGEEGDSTGLLVMRETEVDIGASQDELQAWLDLYTATPAAGRKTLASLAALVSEREQDVADQASDEEDAERWIALGDAFAERLGDIAAEELMHIIAATPDDDLFAALASFFGRLSKKE